MAKLRIECRRRGVIRFVAVRKADGFIELHEASLIHLIIHSLLIAALLKQVNTRAVIASKMLT